MFGKVIMRAVILQNPISDIATIHFLVLLDDFHAIVILRVLMGLSKVIFDNKNINWV